MSRKGKKRKAKEREKQRKENIIAGFRNPEGWVRPGGRGW
jgi:hypothetical protein